MHKLLAGHAASDLDTLFSELSRYCADNDLISTDVYGRGKFLQSFESEIAEALGQPAAVFLPTGIMAQNIALRIWCDRSSSNRAAFHLTSHLEIHEQQSYKHLHHLTKVNIGEYSRLVSLEDIEAALEDDPAVVLLELPMREIGGQLISFEELTKIKKLLHSKGVKLHIDGARLWETQAPYGMPLEEICQGVDSVYVSFYKGIGAISGAVLAGSTDFVEEARVWQKRHGGCVVTQATSVVSSKMNYDLRKDRFESYYQRTKQIYSLLSYHKEISPFPSTPDCNMFHIVSQLPNEALNFANGVVEAELGLRLFGRWMPWAHGKGSYREMYIGDGALELTDQEIREALELFANTAANC